MLQSVPRAELDHARELAPPEYLAAGDEYVPGRAAEATPGLVRGWLAEWGI